MAHFTRMAHMIQRLLALISGKQKLRIFLQNIYVWVSKHVVLLPPLGVAIELTYACNWRCRMCFHHRPSVHDKMTETIIARRREELTTEEVKALLTDFSRSGVRHVSLHGGEPLIRPDFCDILAHASRSGLHISTFTNAALITDEIARQMVTHLHDLGTSIHGGETIHDLVTGIPGSFKQAMEGIKRVLAAKKAAGSVTPNINLACIVTAVNHRNLAELVHVARELGLAQFGFGIVTFTDQRAMDATRRMLGFKGCGASFLGDSLIEPDLFEIAPDEYAKAIAEAKRLANEADIRAVDYPFTSREAIIKAFSDPFYRLGKWCNYPWYSSVISSYGDVYPCIQFSFLCDGFGNIRTQRFRDVWRGPAYREFRRNFRRSGCYAPVCAKCCSIIDAS